MRRGGVLAAGVIRVDRARASPHSASPPLRAVPTNLIQGGRNVKRVLAGLIPIVGACALWAGAITAGEAPILQSAPVAHLDMASAAGAAARVAAVPPIPGVHPYTDTYVVQHPYNLPLAARFSID